MTNRTQIDYSHLDHPQILQFLFHPRKETGTTVTIPGSMEIAIPTEGDILIGGRLHIAGDRLPSILFFHGNGEIVADYDDLAPLYTKMGVNFFPIDYRGYGRSNGTPTVSAMMRDSHFVLKFIAAWLAEHDFSGPLIVMGRSLGSAPALEIASQHPDKVDGLVIESGFAYAFPLLRRIGIDVAALGISETREMGNLSKIASFSKPTLIIHAEFDHIIPFSDGQALFEASPATRKNLLKIDGADHNNIFYHGMRPYLQAIRRLAEQLV